MSCPDRERLGELVAGALEDPRDVAAHVGACASCTEEVAALRRLEDDLRDLEVVAPAPAPSPSLAIEVFSFLREEKKWWLAPLLVILALLSLVIVFAEGSAIAPFIYSIF